MERKKKNIPQNNSCYSLWVWFFYIYISWKLWLSKYFTLLQFSVGFFFVSYIDLFLSISVFKITMDIESTARV